MPEPYHRQGHRSPRRQCLGADLYGLWSNPMARAAVDCREAELGDMRQQVVVGNACGRKSSSHGSKAILLSHASGMEPRGFHK